MPLHLDDAALKDRLETIEQEMNGILCVAVEDLRTGQRLSYRSDRKCKSASIIKLPMLVHLAISASEGARSWDARIDLKDSEKVGGAGVLKLLTQGLTLPVRDLCMLMIVLSDNTATNMLVDYLGADEVTARMRALGLAQTTLYRKAYTLDTEASVPFGFGMTTPEEMVDLLRMLVHGEAGSPGASAEVIRFLEAQALRDGIPRGLPVGWSYAGKTGGVDGVRNDVGVVKGPAGEQFAAAIFCQELRDLSWTPENAGLLAIVEVTRLLFADMTAESEVSD